MSLAQLFNLPSPTERLTDPWLEEKGILIDVKRDDLIHPIVSGNKLRKLQGQLSGLSPKVPNGIVTMGGVWSNHIHATAYLAHQMDLPCVVLLRGPAPPKGNRLLDDLSEWGTTIQFLTRIDYRALRTAYESDAIDSTGYLSDYKDYQFIAEGGYHPAALTGIKEMVAELHHEYRAIYVAVGTATTLAGLIAAWPDKNARFYGIQAVNAGNSQQDNLQRLSHTENCSVTLCPEYQFGGFAKATDELIAFMASIYQTTGLITEPVYTAKALFALYDHIRQGYYSSGDKLLFIHTGGLQGLRGYDDHRLQMLSKSAGF